jgi:acetylornithine/succinyldiaminopimelate/putrescine aminotransferase
MTTDTQSTSALLPVYTQMPVRPVRGRGCWLIDEEGHEWLDAYGGHAVASTGHSHPEVVRAIAEQAEALLFYSTAVPHPNREQLAERLAELCPDPLGRVFFCNSGAEANENALNLARRHTGRVPVLSVTGGWHGRTVATLAVTDGARYEAGAIRAGMALSRKIPFNDVEAADRMIDGTAAAVIVEPVQGMSGARACSAEFLRTIRAACDRHGVVLIFDEIQCGVGRCGAFTAAEAVGVTPDIITLAKGLASGLPIGAVIATPAVTSGISHGDLGSTFGGGPVPCAAGLATLRVQGRGLLLGLQLPVPAAQVQRSLFERRILTGTSSDPAVLRLLPPLSFGRSEADAVLRALQDILA